jgi:hypothetical protein
VHALRDGAAGGEVERQAFDQEAFMTEPDDTRALRRIVDSYGYSWGFQWRRNFGDEARFPIPSFAGKLIEQGVGAIGGGGRPRNYPEVFIGNALEFANALKVLDERLRTMAWVHYVVDMPKKAKAPMLGIHVNTYDQRKKAMQLELVKVLNLECV